MKKYRLIKEYPGSPLLGEIARQSNRFNLQNTYYIDNTAVMNFPEKYSEFWQEVVEKDYEILSFKARNNYFALTGIKQGSIVNCKIENNTYKWETKYKSNQYDCYSRLNLEESLRFILENAFDIYSIKRLSDGEIFTIGDKVINKTNSLYYGIISEIYIRNNELEPYVATTINGNMGLFLNNIEKTKQPLFTTEDGVDIFEGYTFYIIDDENWQPCIYQNYISINEYKNALKFSTKEKAEEYILMNKPCLSLNDIIEDISKATKIKNVKNTNMIKSLKELVNTKING